MATTKTRAKPRTHQMHPLDEKPKNVKVGQIWIDPKANRLLKVAKVGVKNVVAFPRTGIKPGVFSITEETFEKAKFAKQFACAQA